MNRKIFSALFAIVLLTSLLAGAPAAAQNQPAVALGEPGTVYRYHSTLGVSNEPYPADGEHLNTPHGLFVDSADNLFVTEIWAHRMLEYGSGGENVLTLGAAGQPWHHDRFLATPRDVVTDSDHNIWVVMAHAVKQFDMVGGPLQTFPADDPWQNGQDNGHFDDPQGLAIDAAGLLYVADSSNHRVQVFDPAGGALAYVETIGITGTPVSDDTGFAHPTRLAFDSAGNLYVLDTDNFRVQRCAKTTAWTCETYFGLSQEWGDDLTHLGAAYGMTVHADAVYIADTTNVRVLKCDLAGVCQLFAGETGVSGSDNFHFAWPTDVAVDSFGKVNVADEFNHRVQTFDSTGTYVGTYGETLVPYLADEFRLNQPRGLAVTNDGGLLVAEYNGHRLVKYDANLEQEWTYGIPGVGQGHFTVALSEQEGSPAQAADGKIFLSDSNRHLVLVLTAGGGFWNNIGFADEPGADNAHFNTPAGIAISPLNQDIYVADTNNHRVQVFNPDLTYKTTLGVPTEPGSDNGHFNRPLAVAVNAAGELFVADSENFRVQKCTLLEVGYDCATFAGETGAFGDEFGYFFPRSLTLDGAGNVYVMDEWNQRVLVYDPTGAFLTSVGGTWEIGDYRGLINPAGVAVDARGTLYVADGGNHRVQVFARGVPGWSQANLNGFGQRWTTVIPSLGEFDGFLYAGASNWTTNEHRTYRSADGLHWEAGSQLFSTGISALQAFDGRLYAGTWENEIWSSADGVTWELKFTAPYGISHMVAYDNALYAAVYSDPDVTGTTVYKTTDGETWDPFITNGNGTQTVSGVISSLEYDGLLYLGAADWTNTTGFHIWRTDGSTVEEVVTDGMEDPGNHSPAGLAELDGYIYASVGRGDGGYKVFRSPGGDLDTWEQVFEKDPAEPGSSGYTGLASLNDRLYLVVQNDYLGVQVWLTTDGLNWFKAAPDGFGDGNNKRVEWSNAITIFNDNLYLGVQNETNGTEVWRSLNMLYLPAVINH